MTFEIYTSAYGIGYKIYDGSMLVVDQPFAPGVSGFVGMTQEQAEAAAQAEIAERIGA